MRRTGFSSNTARSWTLAERLMLDETLDQDQITEILGTPGAGRRSC
ncbi:MAG: hypothetical protein R3A46_09065 [Thermomicrobiales bacterium]